MKIIILASLMLMTTACTAESPIQQVVDQKKATLAELTNEQGETTLVEVGKGVQVPDCAYRAAKTPDTGKSAATAKSEAASAKSEKGTTPERYEFGPCKGSFNFEGLDKLVREKLAGKDASKIKSIRISIDWDGSRCRTVYNYSTGAQYEICSPPYPKWW